MSSMLNKPDKREKAAADAAERGENAAGYRSDILPQSEIMATDMPKEPVRSPRSPGRDDPALSANNPDPHLKDNPYAAAVHELPVKKLLNPSALKHVQHDPDRVDETAPGSAQQGHGQGMGLSYELKKPESDLHRGTF